jgi:transposase InsO family protein
VQKPYWQGFGVLGTISVWQPDEPAAAAEPAMPPSLSTNDQADNNNLRPAAMQAAKESSKSSRWFMTGPAGQGAPVGQSVPAGGARNGVESCGTQTDRVSGGCPGSGRAPSSWGQLYHGVKVVGHTMVRLVATLLTVTAQWLFGVIKGVKVGAAILGSGQQCLHLPCIIKGHRVRALVDSGADFCYVSLQFLQSIGIAPLVMQGGPLTVKLAAKKSVQVDKFLPCLTLKLPGTGFSMHIRFYVVDGLAEDVILGQHWLQCFNPLIDWYDKSFDFTPARSHFTTACRGCGRFVGRITVASAEKLQQVMASRTEASLLPSAHPAVQLCKHHHLRHLLSQPGITCYMVTLARSGAHAQLSSLAASDQPAHTGTAQHDPPTAQHGTTPNGVKLTDIACIDSVLLEFDDVFARPHCMPPDHIVQHDLKVTTDNNPPHRPPLRLSETELAALNDIIGKLLDEGLIQPSFSPYAAPAMLVKKKDGTYRLVIDYRKLNERTIKSHYPLPRIDDLLDRLHGSCYYTKLDAEQGYFQIKMNPDDIFRTAFSTRFGLFEWRVMPMGCCNAPSTFMSLMHSVFRPYLDKFVIIYVDDILIYSKTLDEHVAHLRQTLSVLREHKIYMKPSKCTFATDTIKFLGYVLSPNGISPDPDNVACVRDWPVPLTVHDLQRFLGFCGFYRHFVSHFAEKALPLMDCMRACREQHTPHLAKYWGAEQQASFQLLKDIMVSTPVLHLYDPNKVLVINTDASKHTYSAVLQQEFDQALHPIAYFSRKMTPEQQRYGTYDREMLAVIETVKQFSHYIKNQPVVLYSDHESLTHFFTQAALHTNDRMSRWLDILQGLDLQLHHVAGKANIVSDALSRIEQDELPSTACCSGMYVVESSMLSEVAAATATDPELQDTLKQVQEGTTKRFVMENGCLFKTPDHLLVIPSNLELRKLLMREAHDGATAGHLGVRPTVRRLVSHFYWKSMHVDIKQYVRSCPLCQMNKSPTQAPYGLLHPLPVPTDKWQYVSLDFVTDLPVCTDGFDTIMTVVDKLTKFCILVPTHSTATAVDTAQLFIRTVFPYSALPSVLITDRDPQFTSHFWAELFSSLQTKLAMSTSHHPQSDGQTERMNKLMQQVLRNYVLHVPHTWHQQLSLVALAINSAVSVSTGYSPYYLMFGREPNLPWNLISTHNNDSALQSVHDMITAMHNTLSSARQHLQRAQQQQAKAANKHRRPIVYHVGDQVLLSTEHLSLVTALGKKLRPKFLGPFMVSGVINDVAVKLALPPSLKLHPVVHVSMVKPYISEPALHDPPPAPVPILIQEVPYYEVENILAHKLVVGKHSQHYKYLVQFRNMPLWEAAWLTAPQLTLAIDVLRDYVELHKIPEDLSKLDVPFDPDDVACDICRSRAARHPVWGDMLLCDGCEHGFHVKCVGLTSVPTAEKWYCPKCINTSA